MVNTIKVYVKDKAVHSKDFLFNRLLPTKVSIYLKELQQLITIGQQYGGLYYLNLSNLQMSNNNRLLIKANVSKYARIKTTFPYIYWHVLLGHAGHEAICRTLKNAEIKFDFSKDEQWCHICDLAKFKRLPIPSSTFKSPRFLYMLCEDTFPLHGESYYRHKYCMIIYDRYSNYTWAHWLRSKSENPSLFMQCLTDLEVKHNLPVVIVQSDRGEPVLKIMLMALTRWLSLGNVCKRILLRSSSLLLALQCSIARNDVVGIGLLYQIGRVEYFAYLLAICDFLPALVAASLEFQRHDCDFEQVYTADTDCSTQ